MIPSPVRNAQTYCTTEQTIGGSGGKCVMCVYDGDLLWSEVLDAFKGSSATKIVILDTSKSGMALSSAAGYPIVFASSWSTQSNFDGE